MINFGHCVKIEKNAIKSIPLALKDSLLYVLFFEGFVSCNTHIFTVRVKETIQGEVIRAIYQWVMAGSEIVNINHQHIAYRSSSLIYLTSNEINIFNSIQ
jgi:hypothetical protein